MMSAYYLTRIRLPAQSAAVPAHIVDSPRSVRAYIDMLRGDQQYSQFTIASFIFHWGLFFPTPLYAIYWVRVLEASEGWIGLFSMVGSATTIVFYPFWGRLSTRRGNLYVIILNALGLVLYPLATAFAPSVEWILPVSFIGGMFTAGYGLAFFNRLLEVSPEQHRASYIATYNSLINITAFVGPLISTLLIGIFGIQTMLIVGAAMRLFGAVLFWRQRDHVKA